MKHLLPGLLIPAVLAGCVSHSASTDAPASIYVDGLIADSAQTISHAQTGLHQTGPYPARPVSPAAQFKPLPPSTPVRKGTTEPYRSQPRPVSQNVQLPALSHVSYNGRPGPLSFPQRAGYARNITVQDAAQRIIPVGWSVNWSPGLEKVRRQRVNLSLNDQWPRVLNNLIAAKSLYATVEWGQSRITITSYSPRPRLFSHQ